MRIYERSPLTASRRNRLRRHVDALAAKLPKEGVAKSYAQHTLSLAERLLEER